MVQYTSQRKFNKHSGEERDKTLSKFKKNMKECIPEANLQAQG